MREIKFRQRGKNNNKSYYWGFINGIWYKPVDWENHVKPEESDQFTGLKDKNGKEIYDGDIFESPSGILFYVLWYKDGWCYNNVDDEPNHISGILSEIANVWKVIGNIYKNPELIKEE